MAQGVKPRQPTLADAIVLADPELFSWFVCGVDLWEKQIEILEALTLHRRVAVKACNASSKTKTAAVGGLWWVSAYADLLAVCITTSSSWGQVEKVIWKEIHALIFEAAKRGFRYPAPNQTDLTMPLGGFLHGMSTNDAVNFHGFHGSRVLFIKDESTGIEPTIHEAIDSVASGGHVVQLDLGNPVTTSGPFNDLFTNPLVKTITIDAFETPNFTILPAEACQLERMHGRLPGGPVPTEGRFLSIQDICLIGDADNGEGGFLDTYAIEPMGGKPRDYLVGRRFAWEVYKKYGIDSPYWQSHVRGQFPDEGSDTLIPLSWIHDALKAASSARTTIPITGGLDVSGPGSDETVLTLRGGVVPLLEEGWYGMSSQRTIQEILHAVEPYRQHLDFIGVDSAVIGHHMCGALAAAGLPIVPINVGRPPTPGMTQRFANLKAQLYWGFRSLFEDTHNFINGVPDAEPGIVIPSGVMSDTTIAQISTLRFEETDTGKMIMERKRDLKKRGVASPDRAESWMLCYASLIQQRINKNISFKLGSTPKSGESPSRYLARKKAARWEQVAGRVAELYGPNRVR